MPDGAFLFLSEIFFQNSKEQMEVQRFMHKLISTRLLQFLLT